MRKVTHIRLTTGAICGIAILWCVRLIMEWVIKDHTSAMYRGMNQLSAQAFAYHVCAGSFALAPHEYASAPQAAVKCVYDSSPLEWLLPLTVMVALMFVWFTALLGVCQFHPELLPVSIGGVLFTLSAAEFYSAFRLAWPAFSNTHIITGALFMIMSVVFIAIGTNNVVDVYCGGVPPGPVAAEPEQEQEQEEEQQQKIDNNNVKTHNDVISIAHTAAGIA